MIVDYLDSLDGTNSFEKPSEIVLSTFKEQITDVESVVPWDFVFWLAEWTSDLVGGCGSSGTNVSAGKASCLRTARG